MLEKVIIPQIYLPILYIAVAVLIHGILKKLIKTVISAKERNLEKGSYNYKKSETLKILLCNFMKYIIGIFTILAILTVYGVDVSSVLAGLGIVGVLLGLALQDFAKDIIAGIGIVLENQYAIGDYVTKIIANHNITEITNLSMVDSKAIVDVEISYEEDIERTKKVLISLAKKLTKTLPDLTDEVQVLGIEALKDSSVTYRLIASTKSMSHYNVQRLMREEVKKCLDEEKIKIPYPQIEVHHGK